jgi:hypothetical protein
MSRATSITAKNSQWGNSPAGSTGAEPALNRFEPQDFRYNLYKTNKTIHVFSPFATLLKKLSCCIL